METGINRPFMLLLADHSRGQGAEDQEILTQIRSIFDHSGAGRRYVTLRESGHFNFSDKCLLFKGPVPRGANTVGKIDARRGLTVAAACVSAFFDVHIKGEESSLLELLPLNYPELMFGPDSQ